MLKNILILLIVTLCTEFCFSQNHSLSEMENHFKTDSKTGKLFHQMILYQDRQDDLVRINSDGIIICLEKIKRKHLTPKGEPKLTIQNQFDLFNIDLDTLINVGLKKASKKSENILDDNKVMVLTHWATFNSNVRTINYNVYDTLPQGNYNYYKSGVKQLEKIKETLAEKLKTGGYTHVLLGSTGWNNDQKTSFFRYRKWIEITCDAAKREGTTFKPFFIGITWPSEWKLGLLPTLLSKVSSVFNKANDADEIGMTYGNQLIWKGIIPVLDSLKSKGDSIPLIALGHSFGARLLTRAAHSKVLFKDTLSSKSKIDLMISAQGAFSVNRFLKKKNWEGGIYTIITPWNKFVATSSVHDSANDMAFHTTYIGNQRSINKLRRSYLGVLFNYNKVHSTGELINPGSQNIHTAIVADDLICKGKTPLVKAHGDIIRPVFGNFLINLINTYAPSRISTIKIVPATDNLTIGGL